MADENAIRVDKLKSSKKLSQMKQWKDTQKVMKVALKSMWFVWDAKIENQNAIDYKSAAFSNLVKLLFSKICIESSHCKHSISNY